jgi:hypothetical protein
MKVKQLAELLRRCDPEAFVKIEPANVGSDYVRRLVESPACLLHFLIDQRQQCSHSDYPHIPPMNEVVIAVGLDDRLIENLLTPDDPDAPADIDQYIAEFYVKPDFHPETN